MLPTNFICFNPSTLPLGINLQLVEKGALVTRIDLKDGIPDSFVRIEDLNAQSYLLAFDHVCLVYPNGFYYTYLITKDYFNLDTLFQAVTSVTIIFEDGESRTITTGLGLSSIHEQLESFKFKDFEVEYDDSVELEGGQFDALVDYFVELADRL